MTIAKVIMHTVKTFISVEPTNNPQTIKPGAGGKWSSSTAFQMVVENNGLAG